MITRNYNWREIALILGLAALVTTVVAVLFPVRGVAVADPLDRAAIYDACAERLSARPTDAWLQGCADAMEPDSTPSATPSASPTASPTGLPSTPSPSGTPAGTSTPPPSPTGSPSPPAVTWPNPTNTGVPAFWQPVTTRSTDLRVTVADSVVQDVLLTSGADILIDAPRVTVRRVLLQGGRVDLSPGAACNRTRIEQSTIRRPAGTVTDADQEGRISPGGWTVDRVFMDGVPEGLRVGGKSSCGSNSISNSFLRVRAPDTCRDWHGDGVQGYDGGPLVVFNVAIDFAGNAACGGGTAPFFYPRDRPGQSNQGNNQGPVTIERLLVQGGGFPFRNGMPGTVRQLKIVNNSWGYGPIDVRCSVVSVWDAQIVTVNAVWEPTTVRNQPCNTESGF